MFAELGERALRLWRRLLAVAQEANGDRKCGGTDVLFDLVVKVFRSHRLRAFSTRADRPSACNTVAFMSSSDPAANAAPTRILYSADWCWYCQRVVEKLAELGVDYEYVEVPVFHSKRSKVLEVSGQTSVPVFVDGDVVLDDDDVIIPYLEEHYAKR